MAEGCQHPNTTFRKPTTNPSHDSSKAAQDDTETERGYEHNTRLCKESPDVSSLIAILGHFTHVTNVVRHP